MLRKNHQFISVFWTLFFGALNDNFFKNAIILLITYKGITLWGQSSASLVAIAAAIFIFPFFIFSASAGLIADTYSKAKLIKITKVTELMIMVIASFGFFTNNFSLLMFTLFLMGAQSAFFGPLKYGVIPEVVEDDEIVGTNALVSAGTFIAILVGTMLGGLAISLFDGIEVVSLGAILFSLIGLAVAFKFKGHDHFKVGKEKINFNILQSTLEVGKIPFKDSQTLKLLFGVSWFWFIGAAILTLLPSLVKDVFRGDESVGTIFLAIFTVGMGVGSFTYEKISKKEVDKGPISFACLGMSVFIIDLVCSASSFSTNNLGGELFGPLTILSSFHGIRALLDVFLIAVFGGVFIVPHMTRIQTESEPGKLSRTIGANNIWNAFFMVLSSIIIIILKGLDFSTPQVLLVFGIGNLLLSFFFHRTYKEDSLRFLTKIIAFPFYRVRVVGAQNIPKEGRMIIISNHVSFVDWLAVIIACPRYIHFVIDHIYYQIPILKLLFKEAMLIPIATKKESQSILDDAFEGVSKVLNNEKVLGIFPEGWITRDGELRKFQPGVLKITKRDPAPIIPIYLDGLWGSNLSFSGKGLMRKGFSFKRRVITVHVMNQIDSTGLTLEQIKDLYQSKKEELQDE